MAPAVKWAAWAVVMVMGMVAPCQSRPVPPPGLSVSEAFGAFGKSDSNHVGFEQPGKPVLNPATTLPPHHHVPLNTDSATNTTQPTPQHTTSTTTELDTPQYTKTTTPPTPTTTELDTPQYTMITTPPTTTTTELDTPQYTTITTPPTPTTTELDTPQYTTITTPPTTTTTELSTPQYTTTTTPPTTTTTELITPQYTTTTTQSKTPQHTTTTVDLDTSQHTTTQPTTSEKTTTATAPTLPQHTVTTTQATTAAWWAVLLVVPVTAIPFLFAVVNVLVKKYRSTPSVHTVVHNTENDEMNIDNEINKGTGDYKKKVLEIVGRSVCGGGHRTRKDSRKDSDCSVIGEEGDNLVSKCRGERCTRV